MKNTNIQYQNFLEQARTIFIQKTKDYGTAWRVLRDISIVDQIYIKVKRICNLQEIENAKVDDSIESEWLGIINYSIIGLIQRKLKNDDIEDLSLEIAEQFYHQEAQQCFELMKLKNHDYSEAWREMHPKSIADICMMKVLRMRQILENKEKLIASEGLEANYADIINYAIFFLINKSNSE